MHRYILSLLFFFITLSVSAEVEVIMGENKILYNGEEQLVSKNTKKEEVLLEGLESESVDINTSSLNLKNDESTKKLEKLNNEESILPFALMPADNSRRLPIENSSSSEELEIETSNELLLEDTKEPKNFKETLEISIKRPEVMLYQKKLEVEKNRSKIAQERLKMYGATFRKIFKEEGVPEELIAIGFVESTYNIAALSSAGARGIWQFMPSTGRAYGLQSIDDFSDPIKSTRASARYLKKLNSRFNDWLLAVAAYNGGEGRVREAIKKSNGSRDFWTIKDYLPRETRAYVPKVIAATVLTKI